MDHMMNGKSTPAFSEQQEESSSIRYIVCVHITRLSWLVLTIVSILLLTIFVRHLTSSAGFIVQQQFTVIAVIMGLALVGIVYTIGIIRMLRKIRQWEYQGKTKLATGALWSLGITALISALPIVLVFLIQ